MLGVILLMYCKKCGEKIKENSKFCSKCGTKVEEIKEQEEKLTITAETEEKEITKKEMKDKKETEQERETEQEKIFCRNCGKKITKDLEKCPECGYILKKQQVKKNDLFEDIVIYIVSFLMPLFGIILWIITKKENPTRAKNALILAIMSIIFKVVLVLLTFLVVIIGLM